MLEVGYWRRPAAERTLLPIRGTSACRASFQPVSIGNRCANRRLSLIGCRARWSGSVRRPGLSPDATRTGRGAGERVRSARTVPTPRVFRTWSGICMSGWRTAGRATAAAVCCAAVRGAPSRRTGVPARAAGSAPAVGASSSVFAGLRVDAYPKIDAFLAKLGARRRWSEEMTERVRAVGEETLLLLIRREDERTAGDVRCLLLIAGGEGDAAVLQFIAATDEANLEDQMALFARARGERTDGSGRSPSGCCGTTPRPCATTSTTTPTSSRFA